MSFSARWGDDLYRFYSIIHLWIWYFRRLPDYSDLLLFHLYQLCWSLAWADFTPSFVYWVDPNGCRAKIKLLVLQWLFSVIPWCIIYVYSFFSCSFEPAKQTSETQQQTSSLLEAGKALTDTDCCLVCKKAAARNSFSFCLTSYCWHFSACLHNWVLQSDSTWSVSNVTEVGKLIAPHIIVFYPFFYLGLCFSSTWAE